MREENGTTRAIDLAPTGDDHDNRGHPSGSAPTDREGDVMAMQQIALSSESASSRTVARQAALEPAGSAMRGLLLGSAIVLPFWSAVVAVAWKLFS